MEWGTDRCSVLRYHRAEKVNDEQGHEAGDRLIIRACECLAGVFKGYGLYRIGGDEFLYFVLELRKKT